MVGRQVQDVLGAKTLPRRNAMDEPVRGERFTPGRAHRDPVAQREGLRPEAVHAGRVAGCVHGEHLAAAHPHTACGLSRQSRRGTRSAGPVAPRRGRWPAIRATTACARHGQRASAGPTPGRSARRNRRSQSGDRSTTRRSRRHGSAPPRAARHRKRSQLRCAPIDRVTNSRGTRLISATRHACGVADDLPRCGSGIRRRARVRRASTRSSAHVSTRLR